MIDFLEPEIAHLNFEKYMQEALIEADQAGLAGELPIGAIVVLDNEIIGRGQAYHRRLKSRLRHAELNAILNCDQRILTEYKRVLLFTTVEPCPMCLGAAVMANIPHIIFALHDQVVHSSLTVETNPYVRRNIKSYHGGVLENESAAIIGRYMPAELAYIQTG